MQSKAKTVKKYLNELSENRKKVIEAVRRMILKNLPSGYVEGMQYGMIGYFVPLSKYPQGYLGKKDVPLPYVSLSSQKNHMAIYLVNVYADKKINQWFVKEYKKTGKKMDMGKSCVRFRKLENLPLKLLAKVVAMTKPEELIEMYENRGK